VLVFVCWKGAIALDTFVCIEKVDRHMETLVFEYLGSCLRTEVR